MIIIFTPSHFLPYINMMKVCPSRHSSDEHYTLKEIMLRRTKVESCLDGGVNRQVETFSTKTRNELGKTGSTGVKTGSTGLNEI
jgi:hypothetical protein